MSTLRKVVVQILLFLFLVLLAGEAASPQILEGLSVDIQPSQKSYYLGETILLEGNLTEDGSLVSDALVSVQMTDPNSNILMVRTLNTSQNVQGNWPLELTEFYSSDSAGHHVDNYTLGIQGIYAGFKITIKNLQPTQQYVKALISIIYSSNIPSELEVFPAFEGMLSGLSNVTVRIWPLELIFPPLGLTRAYCSLLTGYPRNGGIALCPEKSTQFNIVPPKGMETTGGTGSEVRTAETLNGTFSFSFRISDHGGTIGLYRADATSYVSSNFASTMAYFETKLRGDITSTVPGIKDGKCNIYDVSTVAKYFGQNTPPAPSYCDVFEPYGKVDIRDVSAVAKDFGKWGIMP